MRLRLWVLMVLALGAPLFGGGAWIRFADPQLAGDPSAFEVVKLVGCDGKTLDSAQITATAERFVNRQRVSVPIALEKVPGPAGVYSIRWNPPTEGQWVLAFQVSIGPYGPESVAVVKVDTGRIHQREVLLELGSAKKPALVNAAFVGQRPPGF